jgi:DNA replication licensing factor MCM4
MDPVTGKIDLDLVTTGISSTGRALREQKRNAMRQYFKSLDKSKVRWVELYRELCNADKKLTEIEFDSILGDLVDEGIIQITGRNKTERIIFKIA